MSLLLTHLPDLMASLPADVPNPGSGEAPPGSDGFIKIMKWTMYICSGACIIGLFAAGAMMALANSGRGPGGGEHVSRLGWVLGGCIVIGSATAIVGALL